MSLTYTPVPVALPEELELPADVTDKVNAASVDPVFQVLADSCRLSEDTAASQANEIAAIEADIVTMQGEISALESAVDDLEAVHSMYARYAILDGIFTSLSYGDGVPMDLSPLNEEGGVSYNAGTKIITLPDVGGTWLVTIECLIQIDATDNPATATLEVEPAAGGIAIGSGTVYRWNAGQLQPCQVSGSGTHIVSATEIVLCPRAADGDVNVVVGNYNQLSITRLR